ncbi:MAG: FxsA family protein [Pseudomonadota bacterium]
MLLFLALLIVPIVEIGLFIEIGGWLGLWPTIAIVILTAMIGTVLLRTQGIGVLAELQRKLEHGEDPSGTLANGALILVAGVVLLTPGFFTDAVGFLLLIPPVRAALIRAAAHRVLLRGLQVRGGVHVRTGMGPGGPAGGSRPAGNAPRGGAPLGGAPHGGASRGGTTIDGDFTRVDEAADGSADAGSDAPDGPGPSDPSHR